MDVQDMHNIASQTAKQLMPGYYSPSTLLAVLTFNIYGTVTDLKCPQCR